MRVELWDFWEQLRAAVKPGELYLTVSRSDTEVVEVMLVIPAGKRAGRIYHNWKQWTVVSQVTIREIVTRGARNQAMIIACEINAQLKRQFPDAVEEHPGFSDTP